MLLSLLSCWIFLLSSSPTIVDFYVTDDNNHIPIRLDMFLKFGSAKAFLVDMKGVKG